MSSSKNLPDLGDIASDLRRFDVLLHPSECHGQLCGVLCGHPQTDLPAWLAGLMAQNETRRPPEDFAATEPTALADLFNATCVQMDDGEYGFQLLLPDDNFSFAERSEAMASWCRGFLYGLALGGVSQDDELSIDVTEVLKDMLEISTLSGEDAEGNSDDESAFMELEEYLRVGTLLILAELQHRDQSPGTNGNRTVH